MTIYSSKQGFSENKSFAFCDTDSHLFLRIYQTKQTEEEGISILGRGSIYFLKLRGKEHLIKTHFKDLEKHLTRFLGKESSV